MAYQPRPTRPRWLPPKPTRANAHHDLRRDPCPDRQPARPSRPRNHGSLRSSSSAHQRPRIPSRTPRRTRRAPCPHRGRGVVEDRAHLCRPGRHRPSQPRRASQRQGAQDCRRRPSAHYSHGLLQRRSTTHRTGDPRRPPCPAPRRPSRGRLGRALSPAAELDRRKRLQPHQCRPCPAPARSRRTTHGRPDQVCQPQRPQRNLPSRRRSRPVRGHSSLHRRQRPGGPWPYRRRATPPTDHQLDHRAGCCGDAVRRGRLLRPASATSVRAISTRSPTTSLRARWPPPMPPSNPPTASQNSTPAGATSSAAAEGRRREHSSTASSMPRSSTSPEPSA